MNPERKELFKTEDMREVTFLKVAKPIFNVVRREEFVAKKRPVPFLVRRKTPALISSSTKFLCPIPQEYIKDVTNPVFEVKKKVPSNPVKNKHGKEGNAVCDNSGKKPVPKKDGKQEELKEKKGSAMTQGSYLEVKATSIFNELQSISRELVADYIFCRNFAAIDPFILRYWIDLQSCADTLKSITQQILQIPGINCFKSK